MSDGGTLEEAYSEWRRLAEAEGKAIRIGDWRFVADCQQALGRLRPIIDRLTEQTRQGLGEPRRAQFPRATVLELIELQRRNLASLQQRRQRLSAQMEELSRTGRNLRGIQRSYSPPPPPAWNSYS
jgi:hypothetical protein